MKILITGTQGLIGSRAAKVFGKEHEIHGADILAPDPEERIDLAEYIEVKKLFEKFIPEFVIHCAGNGNPEDCEADHDMAIRNNVLATRNIASLCADYNCGLIFCSTDHVYRYKELPETLHEYNETKGASYYGFSKLLCEQEIKTKVKKHYIARLCWQYGFVEPGVPAKPRRAGLVDRAVLSYRNKTPLTVIRGSRNHTSNVYDTLDVYRKMLNGELPYGVYNVACENSITIQEIYETVYRKLGATEEEIAKLLNVVDGEPNVLVPEPYYLKLCGYQMPTFEEGLERFFREIPLK